MSNLKNLVAGVLLLGTLAAPAFAATDRVDPMEGVVIMMSKGGITQTMVSDSKTLDQIVQGAKEIDANSIVVSHNGKMFLVTDHKMPDGRMISTLIGERVKGGNG